MRDLKYIRWIWKLVAIGNTLESGLREHLGVSYIPEVIKAERSCAYFQNLGQEGPEGGERTGGEGKEEE